MNKQLALKDVAGKLRDGMVVGIGGWGLRRKPMALVREIIRSDLKDLTIVSYGGPDIGMLCAAGKVKKAVYGFVSLDFIPLEPYFRKAREGGMIAVSELDEGLVLLGLQAAARRLPFVATRLGLGSDVMTYNPDFKTITSPYDDGEVLLAMPALKLDVALLHVDRSDLLGNTQTFGNDPYFDELFARAADECFVSCEEIAPRLALDRDGAKAQLFERSLVTGVIHAPGGAHPTSCPTRYGWDAARVKAYAASASEDGGWSRYRAEIIGASEESYMASIGGAASVAALPLAVL
jgi:glutaconate CoA-transferase subunit A